MSAARARTFASLTVPNYRRWFVGQVVSVSGNWMERVAVMWLMVQLTGSGVSVGLTAAAEFVPILLLGAWGGLLADRLPNRRLLFVTQALMMLPPLALLTVTEMGAVAPWMLYAAMLARGTINAVDNPARQSFVMELVGADRIVNAVSLNSVVVQAARIVGPAAAGIAIAVFGIAPCFLANALSFAVMIVALRLMDPAQLHTTRRAARARGQLRTALNHVRETPGLFIPLAMMAVIGTLSFNFAVLLPLFAEFTWHGTAATYAGLTAAMGLGSITGALVSGARGRVGPRLLVGSAAGFGLLGILVAAAPSLPLQLAALIPFGMATVTFSAGINSFLQLTVKPALRGRVMALYSVVFLGSTPIGAPLIGWVASAASPRVAVLIGAAAALTAAAGARWAFARAGLLEPAPARAAVVPAGAARPRRLPRIRGERHAAVARARDRV